jgi:hypothetical protein
MIKLTKKELNEIIDSNGDLIGKEDVPNSGGDMETQAHGTTDQNVRIGNQPFRYDMLGRFGFTLLPFFEGEENQGQTELLNDLAQLAYERYLEIIEYYYRNPNKLKSDFRVMSGKGFNSQPDDVKEDSFKCARNMIKTVEKHFENAFKQPENIDEAAVAEEKVIEDKIIDKKGEDEISKKSEDKDVRDKQVEKIAGLINRKLEKSDIDKLITLLEAEKPKEEMEFSEEEKRKIEDFVRNYGGPFKDEDIHDLADGMGLDVPEVEEFIYNLARKGLNK